MSNLSTEKTTRPMNPELKEKWVAALRGGEFRQTCGTLRRSVDGENFYCCFGVLAMLTKQPLDGESIGAAVEALYGIPDEQRIALERMNDGKDDWRGNKQSFQQIADYIEKNL